MMSPVIYNMLQGCLNRRKCQQNTIRKKSSFQSKYRKYEVLNRYSGTSQANSGKNKHSSKRQY